MIEQQRRPRVEGRGEKPTTAKPTPEPVVTSGTAALLKETWNQAIADAAEIVETGFEHGRYNRADTAAAVRALAKL